MEPEHAKGINETERKTPELHHHHEDEKPLLDVSSPSTPPPLKLDIPENAPLHNPSGGGKSQSDGNISSSPENGTTTHSSSSLEPSQTKSPTVQTMGVPQPPAGYDPNRIPASIFSTKPTTNPTEWSVASNESLFSIHMGNNSFSRDYAILFGKSGEFPRPEDWNGSQPNPSGELPRLDEWNSSQRNEAAKSNNNELSSSSLPPVMEVPSHEESSVASGELPRIKTREDSSKRNKEVVSGETVEDHHGKEKIVSGEVASPNKRTTDLKKAPSNETTFTSSLSNNPQTFPSPPRFSDGSGNSGSSFAFPVLVSDAGKTAGSLKVVPEKPEQLEKQQHAAVNASSETRWCSWFTCWPRCC